ncbi:pilin [Marinobacter alkaliphilus]|uniref:Pilin n=1 Tax=Marinobacter alkaliphilus TaxID=254719 RepID=A0ABZ3DZE1_9GAMM
MKSRNIQQGFTIIELLIVTAIIGLLSAIALPAYQNNVTRAQVAESLALAMGMKSQVSTYGHEHNAWPTLSHTTASGSTGQLTVTLIGKYSSVTPIINGTYPTGTLTVTITAGRASGSTLALATVDGGKTWACGEADAYSAAASTIDTQYLPIACKP